MATVTYQYAPNQTVWMITDTGIKEGQVIRGVITLLITETTIEYDIREKGQKGTVRYEEAEVFGAFCDAMEAYQVLLTGTTACLISDASPGYP